jgi:quinolinate synthase
MDKLQEEVLELKRRKNAVILAHYYQEPAIQEVADFVGDSLGLSKQAAGTQADIIVFAGVHFMAETAKILNPKKKVLLPELQAGCSLADSCPPAMFRAFLKAHPDHVVVTYINCSAAIKAMSDIICTSANAVKIVNSIPSDRKIIFAPDRNLGRYVMKQTGRDMVLWDGVCEVHEALSAEKLQLLRQKYPRAGVVAHPESDERLLGMADFVASTTGMISYIRESPLAEFIVATEAGILHKMREAAPGKHLIAAPAKENNACACSECRFMKMNTMEKLRDCLLNETPEITIGEELRIKALLPIERMLAVQ